MNILLEKQRDENQDIQVGFALYEDAPQELRARLWMAVLGDVDGDLLKSYDDARRCASDSQFAGSSSETAREDTPSTSIQEVYVKMRDESMMVPWTSKKDSFRNTLMKAMVEVEWPLVVSGAESGEPGARTSRPDVVDGKENDSSTSWVGGEGGSRSGRGSVPSTTSSKVQNGNYKHDYHTLLQISVGQEDVDDIISRDIHRTFPEHPLFGFAQGQQSLFNLLKAYSLHDLEVGYCQGMAFVAGLLLFYVPEEPAFTIFCRLMDADGASRVSDTNASPDSVDAATSVHIEGGTHGVMHPEDAQSVPKTINVGLRSLYLPGLSGLKHMLGTFDELMLEYMPALKSHLEAHGVASVLYCTQWFLSIYACPFPVHFSARLIDVMLLQGDRGILLRTAMAIMCECEEELLELEAFEALLVHLKVDPLTWSSTRLRRVLNAALNSPISNEMLAKFGAVAEHRMNQDDSKEESDGQRTTINADGKEITSTTSPTTTGERRPTKTDDEEEKEEVGAE